MVSCSTLYVLCNNSLYSQDNVITVQEKGAEAINRAALDRGVDIIVMAETLVHSSCHLKFTNKNDTQASVLKQTSSDALCSKKCTSLVSGTRSPSWQDLETTTRDQQQELIKIKIKHQSIGGARSPFWLDLETTISGAQVPSWLDLETA